MRLTAGAFRLTPDAPSTLVGGSPVWGVFTLIILITRCDSLAIGRHKSLSLPLKYRCDSAEGHDELAVSGGQSGVSGQAASPPARGPFSAPPRPSTCTARDNDCGASGAPGQKRLAFQHHGKCHVAPCFCSFLHSPNTKRAQSARATKSLKNVIAF